MQAEADCLLAGGPMNDLCPHLKGAIAAVLSDLGIAAGSGLHGDAEQEALLLLPVLKPRLEQLSGAACCAYCAKSVANQVARRLRRERRYHTFFLSLEEVTAADGEIPGAPRTPPAEADALARLGLRDQVEREDLFQVLRALPKGQRRVMELLYGGGLDVAEVALCLGMSQDAVRQVHHRAMHRLRILLGVEDGPVPDADHKL